MSEGLRRIAQVITVLGWLWLAMFVVLACITGYGRERDLTRDEQIALYERQTQSKLVDVVASQRAAAPKAPRPNTLDEWLGSPALPNADTVLAAHFKNATPTTRETDWVSTFASVVVGLVGFGIAFALTWIVNGFAVDKKR
ncbi:hypothetical protein [Cupriavidus sp. IK-TO18]|uniref:hypothetical protein n=1 Tax=Cupriavidus sp. IK-TO18 TaxID=2782182 RepID=UPI001897DC3E|nr:hypothetical protein [Cupriavidus sp. IK-TO18]MBF6987242.1 hypothetical protein [Cupriavidus sp. IK-TO18]